jgi:hypothetical protein
MHIYLLERLEAASYDEYRGFVVIAKSSKQARKICSEAHGDEGATVWTDPKRSEVTTVGVASQTQTTPGIILSSFRPG